jgi:4-diphosphocytidyl-2-C-methyl-D-erythritol kinase
MPGRSGDWPAPAKLNLMLRITGRRDDGYHLLQTVFQFVDYGDRLAFEPRADGAIVHANPLPDVEPDKDLTVRAARLLQHHTGCGQGAEIWIDKRLPMGGGLGGGSSDAATVLRALDRIWDTRLPAEELAALGLSLGADVPVFVRGHAAWAEGVGERLTPIEIDEPWYVIIDPQVTVSTAEVFAAPELTRDSPALTIRDFLSGGGENVFEPVVLPRYPGVRDAFEWLNRHARARLTGSGGCVFAAFRSRVEAEAVLVDLPARWQGFVALGRNRSPLLDRLGQEPAAPGSTV